MALLNLFMSDPSAYPLVLLSAKLFVSPSLCSQFFGMKCDILFSKLDVHTFIGYHPPSTDMVYFPK